MKRIKFPQGYRDWVYAIRTFVYTVSILIILSGMIFKALTASEPTKAWFPPELGIPHPFLPPDDPREKKPDFELADHDDDRNRGPEDRP